MHNKSVNRIKSLSVNNTIRILKITIIAILIFTSEGKAGCTGRFVDPIGDICWECFFPVTLGSIELMGGDMADTQNPSLPICLCPKPPISIPIPGIAGGFWEPVRLVDVTKHPFCFVNLGGMEIDWLCRICNMMQKLSNYLYIFPLSS
ncbi:TraU family protein [Candidatus Bandiella euplotis]|uniref:TraU family protein n=1 Tax=Candidatus Bandiella euplotis TaxID=1664265 RepID=UPI002B2621C0|nr:TraU family protein [Candidatus Bandiella woodruffii]